MNKGRLFKLTTELMLSSFILFLTTGVFGQKNNAELKGEIIFASGFGKGSMADSMTLSINGSVIYDNYHFHSLPSLGLANGKLKIIRVKRFHCALSEENEVLLIKKKGADFGISILFRGKVIEKKINFDEGKYVLISVENSELKLEQQNEEVSFD